MAVLQATTITGGLTMHGMAAGFMKINAEGAVVMDTNTYLASGSYLPLSGGTISGVLTISTIEDGKLILRAPAGDTSQWNYINFVGTDGVRDAYLGTDGGGNPQWWRDDNNVNISLGSNVNIGGGGIVLTAADADVRTNRGRFQVYNNAGTGNLGYRIRTDDNGGWRWQFVDGGNNEYFGVAYPSGNVSVIGTITTSLSSGTIISHGSMSDAFGYNSSYGTYIGSPVGGTYYIYANGTFYDNGTFRTFIHSGNIGSQSVSYASSAGNADTVDGYHAAAFPYRSGNTTGYYQVADWMQFNTSAGLYWPSYNGAHIYPNTSTSYGSIRIDGSRNSWRGINFDGAVTLMMNNNETGFYRDGYGWQWRWENGTAYVNKNGQGGGTSATVLDSSNFTSWAAPRSYLDGLSVGFHVYGDANTYYPVLISAHGHFGMHRYSISRSYADTAPWDPIGTGSHKGGLTLTFDWSSDIAWGGNDKSYRIIQFAETYTNMVAGMALPVTGGMLVWLRGGGAGGAFYRLHTPGGLTASATAYMSGYTAANGSFYDIRTDTSNVNSEIRSRFPVRDSGNSDLYVNNNIVWHQGNLTNLNQLSNGPGYITSSSLSSYLPLSGGTMSGNLYIQSGANPTQFNLRGTNPELYVDAAYGGGTARLFINRQSTSNQASLHFTTGLSVSNGTAWNASSGTPWTIGVTNNSGVNDFKIAYGDTYDWASVAISIDTNKAVTITGGLTIYSGLAWNNATPMLNVGGSGDGRIQVRHIWGKQAGNASTDHLWLQYANNGNHVQIGASGGGNDLYVSGNIYMNGYFGGNLVATQSWVSSQGYITSGSFLSNDGDSEQTVGGRVHLFNDGVKRMNMDPRWNESGYDADLGTLHIWAWTAGGAAYGRAGIALYNGSAYQYLTTKASTTGVFVNNTQIVTNSGTWGINITGNSATTSQTVFSDLKINFPSGAGGGHSFGSSHYSMGLDSGNGAWSHPHYRDLIIGYHTGIRLGAHYSGIRFYSDSPTTDTNNDGNGDGGENLLMTVGGYVGTANHTDVVVNNNLIANSSVRAPIFYDSNDTAYYLNPAGGSRLRNLYVGDSGDDWSDPGGWGTQVRFSNGPHVRFVLHARSPGIEAGMYVHTPGSVYIGSYTSHDVSMMYAGNRKMQITNSYIYTDVYLEAAGSLRAPIFYDSNDTNYYVDPNGSSRLNNLKLYSDYTLSYRGQLLLGDTSYNFNFLNGSWAGSITAGILANCADEYEFAIHDSGTSVESLFIYQSSTGRILMGRDIGWGTTPIQAAADFRAPIFYDSQDTGYFCDPNSRSRLSSIDYGSSGYYFAAGDWGWRHNTPSGWIQFGPANSGHAHIYTDRSNFYFNVDVMYQNGNRIYGDNYRPYADSAGNADTVDGYHASGLLKLNEWNGNVYLHTDGRIYGTIFYDANNDGYYLNPNGTSSIVNLHVQGGGYASNAWSSSSGNEAVRVYAPGGASASWDGGITGAFRIKLPQRANNTMWSMTVRIYNYSTNTTSEYTMGNYSYDAGGYNASAHFTGAISAPVHNVRFGNQDGVDCVWIGETNSTWSYPVISVIDFNGGFRSGNASSWDDGWNITYVTSFGTVATTIYPSIRLGHVGAGNIYYDNLYANADNSYGFLGRNVYADTVNGRGSDPLELNYYDGGPVKIGTGTNGSKSLYASGLYDDGNRVWSSSNSGTPDSRYTRKDTNGQWMRPYYNYGNYLTSESPQDLVNQMGGNGGIRVDFMHPSYTGSGGWNHVITFSGYDRYNLYQLGGHYDGGTQTDLYVRHENNHNNTWGSWYRLMHDGNSPYAYNMNQYVRTTDGVTFGSATINGQVYISRHIDANTTWGNCGCTTIFLGWSTGKVMLGNGNTGGHDWSNDRPSNSVVSTMNHYFYNNVYAREDVVAYWSDARLKTNVKPIENALEKINKIGGYFYTPNQLAIDLDATKDMSERVGVMAQEIEEVLPHVVKPAPFNENYKTVQYEKLVPLLIQGIKEQQKQIDELKEQLKNR